MSGRLSVEELRARGPMDELPELGLLFHRLNNQLGIILANAELLENRLNDEPHKLRAGQVVSSALEAIDTVRKLRHMADPTTTL
jgi:hypothetical protein